MRWLNVCGWMSAKVWSCFFFNDTATTEIYTLSLHDALPILNKKESLEENKGELHSQIYEKYNEKGLIKEKNNFIFTDKSLDNFFYIPLIKEIFPKSKIINCKRDTTSSIMSILKTNLKDVSWAHDLNHIFKFFDLYFKKIEYFKDRKSVV